MDWKASVRSAFHGAEPPDEDVIEELADHAGSAYEAARLGGRDEEGARALVEAEIAAWASDPRALRRRRPPSGAPEPPGPSGSWTAGLLHDVRYALRILRRQPGHTSASVTTMALGIAATTTIFSVLYAVLLKPLPWRGADRLVRISETRRGGTNTLRGICTNATYLAWKDRASTLDGLAGWSPSLGTLTEPGAPGRILYASITDTLFPLLGARPEIGRLFTHSATGEADEGEIVLSQGLWRERFGSDPAAIGRLARLDGKAYRVVGVMAASFSFPDFETRAWVPFVVPPVVDGRTNVRRLWMFNALGRLRPGTSPAQAAAEGTARSRAAEDAGMAAVAVFGSKGPADVAVVPYLQAQTAEVRPALLVFMAAVGLLLITAVANVAGLQLARVATRRREIAIRAAIGAGLPRLLRQFLVESVLLALAGGAVGVLLAAALHRALPSLLPADFPRLADIAINLPVLALAAGLTLAAGVSFGLLPALHARRVNLVESLAEDGLAPVGGTTRSRTARLRAFIMAGQVAVACVLLVGALLLARSFQALLGADRGYDPANVLTATVSMPDTSFTPERRVEIMTATLARLRAWPGVKAAGFTTSLPLAPGGRLLSGFTMPSRRGPGAVSVHAAIRQVTPGFLEAMGIRLLAGRSFSDADTTTSMRVAIANRAFAKEYLGNPAVGEQLPGRLVVGVTEDLHQGGITDPATPELYDCAWQLQGGIEWEDLRVVVRTAGDPLPLVPVLRGAVAQADRHVVVDDVRTMEDRVMRSLARPRLYAVLLAGFAAFALLIAAVGLFGVLSYSVAQRSREIGVRTALGANPSDIVRLVVGQGLAMVGGGLAAGLLLCYVLLKPLSALLYGVTVHDAWNYALVAVVLLAVSAAACAIPARRASRVDPLKVLRV